MTNLERIHAIGNLLREALRLAEETPVTPFRVVAMGLKSLLDMLFANVTEATQ